MACGTAPGAPTWSSIVLDAPHTITSRDQMKTEQDVLACFKQFFMKAGDAKELELDRQRHVSWLQRGLMQLPTNMAGLDASRPWFVFWITHALEVLDAYHEDIPPKAAAFLMACQDPTGGFGGGPGQLPHLAPTYASIAALLIAGTEEAYQVPDRGLLYDFLLRMKTSEGGYRMHDQGETDMRGTYCAIAVASMLHMLTDEICSGVADYVRSCQTFEGGIAGEEGLEAHGGYSYCGLAALCIMGQAHALDLHALLNWATKRQMAIEGGFQGRTNKLVDSCYSFWQGAIFPLLREAFLMQGSEAPPLPDDNCWFWSNPLQTYSLLACQHTSGGLRDKPGKSADYYHTCYALSGMATAQYAARDEDGGPCVVGNRANKLERIDPLYNVLFAKAEAKCSFFESLPPFQLPDGRLVSGVEGVGAVLSRRRVPLVPPTPRGATPSSVEEALCLVVE